MKKILAILLCIAMVAAIALTGCGGGDGGSNSGSGSDSASETKKNAGNIATLLSTALGDKSFDDSCWKGLQEIQEKYGIEVDYFEGKQDTTKAIPALTEFAESGKYGIIISGGPTMYESAQAVVEAFPNQKFIHYDKNIHDSDNGPYANAFSIQYKQNEGSYLVGWLAGKLTNTGTVAAFGASESDVIWDFIYGYLAGSKAARDDIKVLTTFIGSREDVAKAKDLALDAMNQDADILFHVAGGAGAGMFEAIAESGGGKVWGIGVDSDQYSEYEADGNMDIANIILTSMVKNVGNSLVWAYDKEVEGTLEWGTNVTLGISEDAVGPAESGAFLELDESLLDEYEQVKEDVAAGKVTVPTSFGKTTQEYWEFANSFR